LEAGATCATNRAIWSIAADAASATAATPRIAPSVKSFAAGIALTRGASAADKRSI
jgi:hypothetical protein